MVSLMKRHKLMVLNVYMSIDVIDPSKKSELCIFKKIENKIHTIT